MSIPTTQSRPGRNTALFAIRAWENTVWKTTHGGDATDAD